MQKQHNTIDETREQQFADLLAHLMDRSAAGEELDLEENCRMHPEFESDLRELWGTLAVTRAAGSEPSSQLRQEPHPEPESAPGLDLPYDLGNYLLEEELGRGGMGIVYRAIRKDDREPVAVKMILAGDFASSVERQRFRAEAEAAARLDHPNIAPIFEIGEQNGMPFYCMRLIEGQTLSQRLAAGPLPTRRAAAMMRKVCDAIQFAHDHGVLHRDIKPSNILIDEDGEPFVVDFGLAKQKSSSSSITRSGAVIGTPSYMSPEQAAGARNQIDFQSDIYSLGAVLYHMITGRPPFLGETPVDTVLMVIEQDPINPRALNPRIHRDLEVIVQRCLQKPKDLRYASARKLSEDLTAFINEQPVSAREGRFGQVIGNLLRETHHAGVLENWGVLWMWHSLVLLIASLITHWAAKSQTADGTFFVVIWTGMFAVWAGVFWCLRRRMGPVMFVERQIAHVWAATMCMVAFLYPLELFLGLQPLDLAPLLAITCGMAFVIKAGILSGSFYLYAIALFICGFVMAIQKAVLPEGDCSMIVFGVTSAACFFFPGLKYYRRKRRMLETNL